MVHGSRHTRLGALILLPIFLIGGVLCTCLTAAAMEPPAHGHHSCCDDQGKSQHHDHRADCEHCSHAKSSETASVKLPKATLTLAWMPAAADLVASHTLARRTSTVLQPARIAPDISPPPILRLKCVLIV